MDDFNDTAHAEYRRITDHTKQHDSHHLNLLDIICASHDGRKDAAHDDFDDDGFHCGRFSCGQSFRRNRYAAPRPGF